MLRLHRIFILVILVLITNHVEAQNDSARNHLMLVPSFFVFNGLRIDYEINISKRHWIQLSPQFYFGKNEILGEDNEEYAFRNVSGFGLNIDHKVYMSPGWKLKPGTYFSYGVTASYLTLQYINKDDPQNQKLTNSFPRIGGEFIIGFDVAIPRCPIIFGPYAGLGYQYTFTNNADIKNHFTKSYYDFAYSGNQFLIGLRIGARF